MPSGCLRIRKPAPQTKGTNRCYKMFFFKFSTFRRVLRGYRMIHKTRPKR
ncbi:unnamed protein product [Acanthoscelides obtectus]|uniref:Uncharacterized protein n=1 Tax=Acanthoscelides obtectus TaxID=200917 RepID=A0A9P0NY47_ACAOB|nr:unnamed protein product [Acanthoscelides obtectus]CAK1648663.1 hypothetical protein AOBTE_LOCUS15810 [Acanthoscelides obtectus]